MELKKARTDLILFTLLTAACLIFLFYVTPRQVAVGNNVAQSDFTQRTFPNLLLGGMAIVSAAGAVTSLVKFVRLRRAQKPEGASGQARKKTAHEIMILLAPYLTFAVIAAYCVLFVEIGFVWSSLLLPLALLPMFRCRKWWYYLIVYGFYAVIYILFKVILYVPLP